MKQDERLQSTPHYLIRKYSSHSHPQKMDQAGASVKTEAPALSFEELMRQQMIRVAGIGKPVIRCEECRDTGWLSVHCPEAGTDIIPCDFCQEEA